MPVVLSSPCVLHRRPNRAEVRATYTACPGPMNCMAPVSLTTVVCTAPWSRTTEWGRRLLCSKVCTAHARGGRMALTPGGLVAVMTDPAVDAAVVGHDEGGNLPELATVAGSWLGSRSSWRHGDGWEAGVAGCSGRGVDLHGHAHQTALLPWRTASVERLDCNREEAWLAVGIPQDPLVAGLSSSQCPCAREEASSGPWPH